MLYIHVLSKPLGKLLTVFQEGFSGFLSPDVWEELINELFN